MSNNNIKGREYTKRKLIEHLVLVEDHLSEKDLSLCKGCLFEKHLPAIRGYIQEATRFFPLEKHLWTKIKDWAATVEMELPTLTEKRAEALADQARILRKEIEEIKIEEEGEKLPHSLLLHSIPHIKGSPGILIDEEVARKTPCIRYTYDGSELVFSKGIIGALDEGQKIKYCPSFIEKGEHVRLKHFVEAARVCKEEIGKLPPDHLVPYLQCMSKELKKRGIEV
jgi:hypothetical protein